MQHTIIALLVLSLACAVGAHSASAEELSKSGKPLTAQQSKMRACNAEAKSQSLKGDERKAFMGTCLKGGAAKDAAPQESAVAKEETPRQAQRKACGAEAKSQSLKGEERKTFVKECMKRPAAAEAHG